MRYELWRGPSELDGKDIVVITSDITKADNRKTGHMVQVYILRTDVSPYTSVRDGLDASTCGSCRMRRSQGGSCYVIETNGINSVWRCWKDGDYVAPLSIKDALRGLAVRLTAYGDLAAVPWHVILEIITAARDHTAYTQQWPDLDPEVSSYVMASVHSQKEADEASALGWRSFRVLGPPEEVTATECPNRIGLQCAACRLCRGGQGPDIQVRHHGRRKWTAPS